MRHRLSVALVMLAAVSGVAYGAKSGDSRKLELAPADGGPEREEPNSCGSPIERDLATFAVFIAEELRHWDVSTDFELDPETGDLRLSSAGLARCAVDCSQTESILALQRPETASVDHDPEAFRDALVAGWKAQRLLDARSPLLEDFTLARFAKEPGDCGTMYWYDTKRLRCSDDCTYGGIGRLANRLTFAGYPDNLYLNFQTATALHGREGSLLGLDPTDGDNTGGGLDGHCYRLFQGPESSGLPYLDAYTTGESDGDVVTRSFQDNDTQVWCFNEVSSGVFTIQHRSFSGLYLDAYLGSNDYKAALRSGPQTDGSQYWQVTYTTNTYPDPHRIAQQVNGRYLEALTTSGSDYRAVTRPGSSSSLQRWELVFQY